MMLHKHMLSRKLHGGEFFQSIERDRYGEKGEIEEIENHKKKNKGVKIKHTHIHLHSQTHRHIHMHTYTHINLALGIGICLGGQQYLYNTIMTSRTTNMEGSFSKLKDICIIMI